ncbi:MAG TPA: DUF6049 family protein, partial [Kineosporiaceae bacterium]|nr:DUF6049 family protein [Kineosporiaceae bacterium]
GSQRPFALPFGDPDLAAIAHAGQDAADLLGLARSLADTATRQMFGDPLRSDVALPADGRADPATAHLLSSVGWQSVVLAGSSLPPATPQVTTAPPRATITQDGTLAAALYDEQLSSLIAQLGTPQSAPALQRLTAELATITAEHPGESRSVLAVAPRDWDPDPTTAGPALQVLRRLPWVQLQSMDALLAERPSDLRRNGLQYPRKARAAELPTEHVQAVADAHRSLEAFRPALTQPELVVPQLQRYEVSVLGLAWRSRITELAAARQPLASGISRLYDGVVVAPPSVQQLISHSGRFQVYVQNRLDQPVQVQLQLQPRSGRLLVRDPAPFTVPANGHHAVFIAVRAVANGDAVLDATLWTSPPGAEPISPSLPILVQVHSNWENIGLSGAGILLGLLVVAGLVRGVRRGRNPLPPESAPDADEEVVRRESGRRWPFGRGGDGPSGPGPGGTSAVGPGIAGTRTSPAPTSPASPADAPGPGLRERSAGSDDPSGQHPVRRQP